MLCDSFIVVELGNWDLHSKTLCNKVKFASHFVSSARWHSYPIQITDIFLTQRAKSIQNILFICLGLGGLWFQLYCCIRSTLCNCLRNRALEGTRTHTRTKPHRVFPSREAAIAPAVCTGGDQGGCVYRGKGRELGDWMGGFMRGGSIGGRREVW